VKLPVADSSAHRVAANMVQTSFSDDVVAGVTGAATRRRKEASKPADTATPPDGVFSADLLAKMSHQLRSPLAGITGLTRIMLLKARTSQADPTKLVQQLEMIRASAQRSMATVERVLDVAKVELAAAAAEFKPVDLRALLTEAAGASYQIAEQRATVISVDIPLQPIVVATDPEMLSRLLHELLDNALRFADPTEVHVAVGSRTGQVAIEVSDDGAGIPDKDQVRIFEAFERGSGAAQAAPDGIGMGLYLARKIANRLGAVLSVSSQPGAGSTFTVAFGEPPALSAPGPCSQTGG